MCYTCYCILYVGERMSEKIELWIWFIISLVVTAISIYTLLAFDIAPSVPDWYPDITDVRGIGVVVGGLGLFCSGALLWQEYISKKEK